MGLRRCDKGHIYFGNANKPCPRCKKAAKKIVGVDGLVNKEMPLMGVGFAYIHTRYEYITKPVGWLVATKFMSFAESYELRVGQNIFGTSESADLKIDIKVSDALAYPGTTACIFYDINSKETFAVPVQCLNNVYVNDEPLVEPVKLKDYDIIKFGRKKFVFRSFCNKEFDWSQLKNDDLII